jgi:hypothetical protein
MTAEIAIMNKLAVALAADSAVSIETTAETKIYNSNKLFMLSKYRPVGVMVYGSADLMGVPWETIIKTYRRDLRDNSFKTLEEYGINLLAYLDKNLFLFPPKRQERDVYISVLSYFSELIVEEIDSAVEESTHKGLRVTETQIKRILDKSIKEHHAILESLPRLTTLPTGFEKELLRKYADTFDKGIDDAFQKLPISASNRKQLRAGCKINFSDSDAR